MLLLNEGQIASIYGMKEAIVDVEVVLKSKAGGGINNPPRTVIELPERSASALYMPSSDTTEEVAAMKVVTIFPENPKVGKPTTQGITLLTDVKDGSHLAMMNASYLTRLRTGALSALATDRLARRDSKVLTVIGTGAMAFEQVLGVLAVREISEIYLVNPTESKAVRFGERLRQFGVDESVKIEVVRGVSEAVRGADIINCSARSEVPVFNGADVKAGVHVNGVGSYLPHMREVDLDFIRRAEKIVVDDLHGVEEEAGELIHAVEQGFLSFSDVHGELMDLISGHVGGRENDEEITFFKSVGAAYFDLAVAKGVYRKAVELNVGLNVEI